MSRLVLLPLTLFVLLFALSAVLGVPPAYDVTLSWNVLAAILGSAALYLLAAYLVRTRAVARAIGGLFVAAVTALALVFIAQFGHLDYGETPAIIRRLGEATTFLPSQYATYLHPNGVATLLEVALPLAAALLSSSSGRRRVLPALASLVLVYAFFLTFSRGAWVGLGAAAGLALLARLPRRTALALLAGAAVIGIGAAAAALLLGPERLPFLRSALATAGSRLTLYRNTLYLGSDYAFSGIGLGDTYSMVYSRYSLLIFVPFLTYAHNLPLMVWIGQGVLGVIALAGILVAFYTLVVRTLRRAQPDALFHGAWLGVTATLAHGLTDARQYTESPWAMPALFVTVGLAAALARLALDDAPAAAGSRSPLRRLAVVAVVALVAAGLALNALLRALWHTNRGALDETRAELAPALTDASREALNASAASAYLDALAIDPGLPNANRRLGNLYVALGRYADAVPLLEKAAAAEPDYPAAVKGLGLAYVWVGRTADAARMFARLDSRRDIINELRTWSTFRSESGQPELSRHAAETADLLSRLP